MFKAKIRVSSGISQLDRYLDGLYIGDNVIWYDDAGSLAETFSFNFIKESASQNKSLIYISFDRSPKTILENLGPLAESQHLTILDCFTQGKGDGSDVFSNFYEKNGAQWLFQVIMVTEPWKPEKVSEAIYNLHDTMKEDVRLVFDSLTGMQNLWGGEDQVLTFYSHSCPRLYELDTIAYWILEKGAHSERLKAHINQIAQVAIDLTRRQGWSAMSILKADKRKPYPFKVPIKYHTDGMTVIFESDDLHVAESRDIGSRIKELRNAHGLSQKKLAGMVGVTPSTISQFESGAIYPSLPVLFKIANAIQVDVSSFFRMNAMIADRIVFPDTGIKISFNEIPKGKIEGRRLMPADLVTKADPYIIDIPEGSKISSHFFVHKGEELGYVLSGEIEFTIKGSTYNAQTGNLIYLLNDHPSQWVNIGKGTARILWIKN